MRSLFDGLRGLVGAVGRTDEAFAAVDGKWTHLSGPATTVEQVYAHGTQGMWSRLRLPSGERILVSQTAADTRLVRLNKVGLPGETLCSVETLELVTRYDLWGEMSPQERSTEILTRLTREAAQCASLDELRRLFDPRTDVAAPQT